MKKTNLINVSFLLVVILSMGIFGLTSCEKDDSFNDDPNSNSSTPTYELRFTSTSDNPYLIEVDGNSNVIQGNTYKTYYLEKGTYSWKVTQESGYLFYPTVREGTVNLDTDKEIVFP
jgi:hypothetical protein